MGARGIGAIRTAERRRQRRVFLWTLAGCVSGACLLAATAEAEEVRFTDSQARVGETAYRSSCAPCHGERLEGDALAPPLVGERFALRWSGKAARFLLTHTRRMPMDPVGKPGSLSDSTYAAVLAFLFERNGLESGEDELPADRTVLASLSVPPIGDVARASRNPREDRPRTPSELLASLSSVDEELLAEPAPEDWPAYGRSHEAHGFSPLEQIDRANVDQLELAWRVDLRPGENQPAPVVQDGVLFFQTYPDTTLALDASTGRELWRFEHESEATPNKKMGLALHDGKVLVPTSDLGVVALDIVTGEPIWHHTIRTEASKDENFYAIRAAPLVAGGVVMQGLMSFRAPRGGLVVGIDLETGQESWRFHTVAWPDEVGGHTWNDLPLDARNGGSVWVTGSYDRKLGLAYFGPAPTYDTAPLMQPVDKPGINNDALFTNATVALDPKTGRLVWYFQHLANDQWDLDWAFERQIVDLVVEGEERRVVTTVGKSAILDAVDAASGEYLFSIDLGLQNVYDFIDPQTGRKSVRSDQTPSLTQTRRICPTAIGARSWPTTSYNPETQTLFLPLTEGCMTAGPEGSKGLLTSGVGLGSAAHPASSDGNMGRLQAVRLDTRQQSWSYRQPTPLVSSSLATAGGVVFVGDLQPALQAFDDRTGEPLWSASLDAHPGANLLSYAVEGRQYVVVVVGQPNNLSRDWNNLYRRLAHERGVSTVPEATGGAALLAFALPE